MKNPNKSSKLKSQEEGEMLEEEEMLAVDEAVDEVVLVEVVVEERQQQRGTRLNKSLRQLQVQNARKWRKLLKNQ